jgi:hypothetical protein
MKQQVTMSLDKQVVEKLDSYAVKKGQKRGEAVEALLCERFGIILIRDKVALNIIKERDEEIAKLQNQLKAALAEVEVAKKKAKPGSIRVMEQLPLSANRSGPDSERFTMERG